MKQKKNAASEYGKIIPGYSSYSLNDKDEVISNKTGNKLNVKSSTGKFQLFGDDGKRKELSLVLIKALIPKDKPVEKKVAVTGPALSAAVTQATTEVKPKKVEKEINPVEISPEDEVRRISELKEREDISRILNEVNFKQHEKIYRIHKLGIPNKDITAMLGCGVNVVSRDLWLYSSGRKPAPF